MLPDEWIIPDWPAAEHVHAICTTRQGGVSSAQYGSLNPAVHVGDKPELVRLNRKIIEEHLPLKHPVAWLEQTHSSVILNLDKPHPDFIADGSTTISDSTVCVVMTADCLPVLLTDKEGGRVAAVHAGWRGLADGILEKSVESFAKKNELIAWLGPAIGADKFEVGADVIEQLSVENVSPDAWCRKAEDKDKYLVDIYALARARLSIVGVTEVSGGGYCTFTEDQRFFSYRRQGDCGRMATMVWLDSCR